MIIGSSQRLNKVDSISFNVDNMDLDEVSSFKYLKWFPHNIRAIMAKIGKN